MIDHTTDPLTYARWELGVYQKQIESFARKMAAALAEGDTRKADRMAHMIEGTVLNMKDARKEATAAEIEAHRATFARNIDRAAAVKALRLAAIPRRAAMTQPTATHGSTAASNRRLSRAAIEDARHYRQPTAETDYTGAPIAAD